MLQIRFLVITFLLTRVLSAETASIPEKDTIIEESHSSERFYVNIKSPLHQDMHFPDPERGKMYRTEKGAMWKGKKGNFDITVSIDDQNPYDDFKAEWGKKESKDNSKKKKD